MQCPFCGKEIEPIEHKLIEETRRSSTDRELYFLQEGARSWYLTFELPTSIFTTKEPPFGYTDALNVLQDFFNNPDHANRQLALEALNKLSTLNYEPSLLYSKSTGNTKSKRKKISGGCS